MSQAEAVSPSSVAAHQERLPGWMGPAYGAAYFGTTIVSQVIYTWIVYFYAPAPGQGLTPYVPVALVGVALSIGRIVDALADPLVGVWSDNTRSRWGRRLPFIAVGAPLMALTFSLIWRPPVSGESMTNFYYLTGMSSVLLVFFTVCVAPYLALLPELAYSQKNRVWLASWQAGYTVLGVIVAMVGASLLIDQVGFAAMGSILAVAVLIAFFITIVTVSGKERRSVPAGLGLREATRLTVSNRPFMVFMISQVLFWFGFNIILATVPYLVTVIMGLSEGDVGLLMAGTMVVAVLSIPLLNVAIRSLGLKVTLLWTMGVLALVLASLFTIGMPVGIDPVIHGAVLLAVAGIPLAGLFILPVAITAEVIDYDTQQTGKRREGMYYGVAGFLQKGGLALSSLVVTGLLHTYGFSAEDPLGIQLSGPVAAACVLVGMLVFRAYPLGKPVTSG